jgi:hypothetical protein
MLKTFSSQIPTGFDNIFVVTCKDLAMCYYTRCTVRYAFCIVRYDSCLPYYAACTFARYLSALQGLVVFDFTVSTNSVCLFVYFKPHVQFSAIWRLSPLPVTGLQVLAYARRSGPLSRDATPTATRDLGFIRSLRPTLSPLRYAGGIST